MSKILTLEEQKHLYKSLAEVFQESDEDDIAIIIEKLGLDTVVDSSGNIIPVYSLDIRSDKPTYITNDYSIKLTSRVYNYFADVTDTVVSWEWTRNSGNSTEDALWNLGKNTPELNLEEVDFTSRLEEQDVVFKLKATFVRGITTEDTISFSKSQTFSKVQISSDKGIFIGNSPSEINYTATADFVVANYRWYIDSVFVGAGSTYSLPYTLVPIDGSVIVKVEAQDMRGDIHTDIMAIPRLKGATDGEPGEPGVPGPPGTSTYTWIKYSNSEDGADMSEYPLNPNGDPREYIGMAYNKESPVESNDPLDYTWSKYIGEDGVPGENGYMWIKYSKYENGRDTDGDPAMYDSPFIMEGSEREDMLFMGIAYNKLTKTEASQTTPEGAPEQYTWARIKGEDGHTGYILELSNDNVSIPAASDGSTPNPIVAYSHAKTEATLYYGNDIISPVEYGIVLTAQNATYSATNNNSEVQITNLTQDAGSLKFEAYARMSGGVLDMSKKLASATFTLSKVMNASAYEIFPSTNVIKVNTLYTGAGGTQELQPNVILLKVLRNTGESTEYVTTGRLTYRYIYENTINTDEDGTEMPIDTNLTLTNMGNPLFIEFKYFHPMTNLLVDRERIPFVRDGISGNTTEFRYRATSSTSNVPTLTAAQKITPDLTSAGWTKTVPAIPANGALWAIQAEKKATGELIGEWSSPILMTGVPGPPGTSGTGYTITSSNPIQSIAVGSDGIVGLAKEYLVTIKVYSNGLELEATTANANPISGNQYLLELPGSPATGVTVEKQTNNTLKYIVASGTTFTDSTISSNISVRISTTLLQMNSNFVLAPIFTAEDITSLDITTTSTVVKYDTAGTLIGPSSITVQAMQQNYNETILWETIPAGIASTPGPDDKIRIFNAANLFAAGRQQASIKISTPNGLWDQVTIVKVQDGEPGASGLAGTTGMIPRLMEWIPGSTYEIGGEYIDYAYFRTTETAVEGWYTVRRASGSTSRVTAIANSGTPNLTLFKKEPFTSSAQFGTVIAEQANLAGFQFRNQILQSQAKSEQVCSGVATEYHNLTINGLEGTIKFLERMHLDKNGITLKDDCQRPRMKFQWDPSGAPVLEFLDEDGIKVWEAGQGGYVYIETGTRPSVWEDAITMVKISALDSETLSLATNPDSFNPNFTVITNAGLRGNVMAEILAKIATFEQLNCSGSITSSTPYFSIYKTDSFPLVNNVGAGVYRVFKFIKGDMAADVNKYNAYYRSMTAIDIGDVPSPPANTFVPDGWYFMQGNHVSGVNRNHGTVCLASIGVRTFLETSEPFSPTVRGEAVVSFVYMENGIVMKTVQHVERKTWDRA